MRRLLRASALLFALAAGVTNPLPAQDPWHFGGGLSVFLGAESGGGYACDVTSRSGLMQRVGRELWGPRLAVEANLRAHIITTSEKKRCIESHVSVPYPRPDGIYFREDHPSPLLTSPFTGADLRIRTAVPLPVGTATVSVGAGHFWHAGGFSGPSGNKPFLVAGAGVLIGSGPRWRVGVEGEVFSMSSGYWRSVTTWSDGTPSFEFLGTFHERLWATSVTLTAKLRL